ncbi:MAG: DUF6448 family protein [Candidatus Omnitrophica bacterium]|nr:DUF6448 family protein [Candidatus Omnitrophota bacterium]
MRGVNARLIFLALFAAVALLWQDKIFAHCDTLDGPVINDAKIALEKSDVAPVLKWVKDDNKVEIETAFDEALAARMKGEETQKAAEAHFFETVVRIHRQNEGAEFTGLKPAGTELEPAVREADKALEAGSVDNLIQLVTVDFSSEIRRRIEDTLEKKKHADESVKAGREFVKAYVDFVHYAEHVHLTITGKDIRQDKQEGAEAAGSHLH